MHRCVICNSTEMENTMEDLGLHRPIHGFVREGLDYYCNQCYNVVQDTVEDDKIRYSIVDEDEELIIEFIIEEDI